MSLHAFWQPASAAAISLIREREKRTERASITPSCLLLAYISSSLLFSRERRWKKESVVYARRGQQENTPVASILKHQIIESCFPQRWTLNIHSRREIRTWLECSLQFERKQREGRKTSWQKGRWFEWMKQHVEGIELPEQGKRAFLPCFNISIDTIKKKLKKSEICSMQ